MFDKVFSSKYLSKKNKEKTNYTKVVLHINYVTRTHQNI